MESWDKTFSLFVAAIFSKSTEEMDREKIKSSLQNTMAGYWRRFPGLQPTEHAHM
jgi:hypothetical protein